MATFLELVNARQVSDSDVIAYYPLVDGDIGDDYGPNARDAVTVTNINTIAGPFAGENVADAGTNPIIELPVAFCADISGLDAITVMGWIKVARTDTFRCAMVFPNSNGDEAFRIYAASGASDDQLASGLRPQVGDSMETGIDVADFPDDTWAFFCVRHNLDNASGVSDRVYLTALDDFDDFDSVTYDSLTFTLGDPTPSGAGNRPTLFKRTITSQSDAYWDGALAHIVFIGDYLINGEVQPFRDADGGLTAPFTPIWAKNQALYGILASLHAKQQAPYGGPINTSHQSSYSMAGFHAKQQSSYGISAPIWAKGLTQYAITDYDIVLAKNQALHASPVLAKQQTQWGLSAPIYAKHADSYELSSFNTILAKNQSLYALPVLAKHQAPYAYPPAILAKHETEYGLHGGILAKHESAYEMLSFNRVLARHGDIYELLPDATPYTAIQDHYLTVGTRRFQVQNADVSMSEGDLGWSANITLARRQDAYQFVTNTDFTMTIGVTTWTLRVDRIRDPYQVSTSDISADITIQAKSPALFTVGQFAETIDVEYPNTVMAKTAAEEIAEQSIDWQTVDWPITGGSLVFEKISRLDAVKKIAEAVGASLESKPDGTLSVISRVPVAVPLLPSAAATAVTDRVIYSREVVNTHQIGINKVEVLSVLATNQDTMEATVDPEDWRFFDVAAYVSPWRTQMTITDTHSDVSLYRQGNRTEQLTETVEFIDGQASVSKPIYQINSVTWQTSSLGSTSFVSDTNQIISSTRGYSLAEVVYTVRYLAYRAYSQEEISAQLLLNDLVAE